MVCQRHRKPSAAVFHKDFNTEATGMEKTSGVPDSIVLESFNTGVTGMGTLNQMMGWTQADERKLQNLMERKADTYGKNKATLLGVVERSITNADNGLCGDITDTLINNADQFLDALKPFDSGVRVAPEEIQEAL
jgi:hypothetical protein